MQRTSTSPHGASLAPHPCPVSGTTTAAPLTGGHHMITRRRAGIIMPNPRYRDYACTASTISPLSSSIRVALRDPNWHAVMQAEFDALRRNSTWRLVPRPPGVHVISGKWVFKHKMSLTGHLKGTRPDGLSEDSCSDQELILVKPSRFFVKPATIRTVLTIIATKEGC